MSAPHLSRSKILVDDVGYDRPGMPAVNGTTFDFHGEDNRELVYDQALRAVTLGNQVIGTDNVIEPGRFTGVDRSYLGGMERGEANPTVDVSVVRTFGATRGVD